MDNDNEEVQIGNPLWLLVSIPTFFVVWLMFDFVYALVAGIGSLLLLYVIFVWLPNDEARKLNRKQRFQKANKLIREVRELIGAVKDRNVAKNMNEAVTIFESIIQALESKSSYQGIIEDKLVPTLEDCVQELGKWIGHENGRYPLLDEERDELFAILTHKDELFSKWQNNSIDTSEYLTSKFRSKAEMEAAGIDLKGDRNAK